jgi:alpha-mannosidase
MVIRCVETEGKTTTATIKLSLPNKEWTAKFKPCEIKTFIVPKKKEAKVTETDMLESPI